MMIKLAMEIGYQFLKMFLMFHHCYQTKLFAKNSFFNLSEWCVRLYDIGQDISPAVVRLKNNNLRNVLAYTVL